MKLVVPLTIPNTFVISVAARLSWITRMTGHHAGDRRLEAQLDAGVAGGLEQLVAVLGDELLVRGHHVASRLAAPRST